MMSPDLDPASAASVSHVRFSIAGESPLSVGTCAQLACILEATARKPGNVHPGASFADCTYLDYLLSAAVIGPVLDRARERGVGPTILEAVTQTRRLVSCNTNLGMLLLLGPLAAMPAASAPMGVHEQRAGAQKVLASLTHEDARAVYAAIRLAGPAGMGSVAEQDVSREPTVGLVKAMALAAERDLVARQYADGFCEVFAAGMPALKAALEAGFGLEQAIIHTHLRLMARHPDTLIARKRGTAEAEEASRRAAAILSLGWPEQPGAQEEFKELDTWLRADGNARNPGTTADLVTACLFVALRGGMITAGVRW